MLSSHHLLLIPDKVDIERDSIASAWKSKGGTVLRIGKFWIKPDVDDKIVSLYGYDSFCLVLAQILQLDVISPKDEWIAKIHQKWTKRNLSISSIGLVQSADFPIFIKPVTPKLFPGKVFQNKQEFLKEIQGLKDAEQIILSEIIAVEKEIRTFILDGKIADIAFYEGKGNLREAKTLIEDFLLHTIIDLPKTFVLDLGYNDNLGWFIMEFNSSWGAGLNSCDANLVVDCIKCATFID